MIETAFGFAANNGVAGDYLEFGVYEGSTFAHACRAADRWCLPMRLHAFDSFAGLPDLGPGDDLGQFYAGQYSADRELFERTLRRAKADIGRVTITPGYFSETLTKARAEELGLLQAAVVWIDCDLYSSTLPVLEFIGDFVADGAVLCFDDWFCFKGRPDQGEQRACAEWLETRPNLRLSPYRSFHWAGQSFIVTHR